eukprot:1923480-Amphidinium_carterae.1
MASNHTCTMDPALRLPLAVALPFWVRGVNTWILKMRAHPPGSAPPHLVHHGFHSLDAQQCVEGLRLAQSLETRKDLKP